MDRETVDLCYRLTNWYKPKLRPEIDDMGVVLVPQNSYFGASTMRALVNFLVGGSPERIPKEIIQAIAIIKKAAAFVNKEYGLDAEISEQIINAADDVISGELYDDNQFPLVIWQSGSGCQTVVNVNEVIAHRANELITGNLANCIPVHPKHHVNMSQNIDEIFPTATNIAVTLALTKHLRPDLETLSKALQAKAVQFKHAMKVGRTHLMDSGPLTFGQEFSGYKHQVDNAINRITDCLGYLYVLPLNNVIVTHRREYPSDFVQKCINYIAVLLNLPFVKSNNIFECLSTCDALVALHGELNTIAVSLMKIANDIRLMSSGPRCGLNELILPDYDDLAQCESLSMIAAQVMGNQVAVSISGSKGQFELNAFAPSIASNVLRSIKLLAAGCLNFANKCVIGIKINTKTVNKYMDESFTLALALIPHIGYEKTEMLVQFAFEHGTTLKVAANKNGISSRQFNTWIKCQNCTGPCS